MCRFMSTLVYKYIYLKSCFIFSTVLSFPLHIYLYKSVENTSAKKLKARVCQCSEKN